MSSANAQSLAQPAPAAIEKAYQQSHWEEVVRLARPMQERTAAVEYDYGMSLAHLGQMEEARSALVRGAQLCPREERFPVELAGVAFERKRYPEAAQWLRRALRLKPKDQYANDFAGTVYYLMGNLPAAVHSWNRVGKPYISSLDFAANLRVHQLLLSRAFTFSPEAVLTEPELETTEARLQALGIFPDYNLVLNAQPDGKFAAQFHAMELNGMGTGGLAALISIFSGLPYETVYPDYFNLGRSAMNFESLLRWDDQKRRVWAQFSGPLHEMPQNRWTFSTDLRNENWAIRRSFAGPAPLLGALNLRWERADATVRSVRSGRLAWSLGAELSHRNFRSVDYGSALNPSLMQAGYGMAALASVSGKPINVPQRRFYVQTGVKSVTGRLWSKPGEFYEKVQGSALAHWYPRAASDNWEVSQRVRAGGIAGSAPFDQLFILGVERDTNLWLRGHLATRDGKKGSGPTGDRFFLANSDVYRRVYSNGLISVAAGPLLDIGRAWAQTTGLAPDQWLYDTGVAARISVLGTRVDLSWGWDLRTGQNAFFGTAE